MKRDLGPFLVGPDASIREVMALIDRNARGIALVVDAEGRLLNTITDGDIRRAILDGTDVDLPARMLLERRTSSPRPDPWTVAEGTPEGKILELMQGHRIRQVPVLDAWGRVTDVAFLEDLVQDHALPLQAVVMAGGFGRRLRPLTDRLPKPMLPVGDRPLLERTLEKLRRSGVRRVQVTTHYKGDVISDHFGDGAGFGLEIGYLREDQPLGTAGALGLLRPSDEPILVINGDVLTDLDFRALLDFHREHEALMTVGVRQYEISVPFGVIESDGARITGMVEKPSLRHFVNAGIYLLEPEVCGRIPAGRPIDMPDLIGKLLEDGLPVVSFPVREYWLDVGRMEDYERAQAMTAGEEE